MNWTAQNDLSGLGGWDLPALASARGRQDYLNDWAAYPECEPGPFDDSKVGTGRYMSEADYGRVARWLDAVDDFVFPDVTGLISGNGNTLDIELLHVEPRAEKMPSLFLANAQSAVRKGPPYPTAVGPTQMVEGLRPVKAADAVRAKSPTEGGAEDGLERIIREMSEVAGQLEEEQRKLQRTSQMLAEERWLGAPVSNAGPAALMGPPPMPAKSILRQPPPAIEDKQQPKQDLGYQVAARNKPDSAVQASAQWGAPDGSCD